ncbi:MAG: hypothetical protein CMH30_03030 [Micavibrio sp.]|nr:hypothetical protein [Micavibrio sp.]
MHVTLTANTRTELILLMRYLAEPMVDILSTIEGAHLVSIISETDRRDERFSQDQCNSGKSMLVEAMMKAVLDDYSVDDMLKPFSQRSMFLESAPDGAENVYTYIDGKCDGQPVILSFDRIHCIADKLPKLAGLFSTVAGVKSGIAFYTDNDPMDGLDQVGSGVGVASLLHVNLLKFSPRYEKTVWQRSVDISMLDQDVFRYPHLAGRISMLKSHGLKVLNEYK